MDVVQTQNLSVDCEHFRIPTSMELFQGPARTANVISVVLGCLMLLCTFVIFLETVIYIHKNCEMKEIKYHTAWVLAVYPVFSLCSLVGVAVPRAATVVDLVMDVFFATCLNQFMLLLIQYLGKVNIEKLMENQSININTPPLCCCCLCLPRLKLNRKRLRLFRIMVMQTAVLRPLLSFVAAVLWAEQVYIPGDISDDNAYVYITTLNILSSVTAVWGLFLIRTSFHNTLRPHKDSGKFMCLQLVVLLSVVPALVINILVATNVIPCSNVLPSKARGHRIHHGLLVCLMLPMVVLARRYYRYSIKDSKEIKVAKHNEDSKGKIDLHCGEHPIYLQTYV